MKRRLRRLCACGCGRRVKDLDCIYYSQSCVPSAVRAAGARKSRRVYAWRQRRKRHAASLERLKGRRITQEELLAEFKRIERAAYIAGFQCGRANGQPALYTIAEGEGTK